MLFLLGRICRGSQVQLCEAYRRECLCFDCVVVNVIIVFTCDVVVGVYIVCCVSFDIIVLFCVFR